MLMSNCRRFDTEFYDTTGLLIFCSERWACRDGSAAHSLRMEQGRVQLVNLPAILRHVIAIVVDFPGNARVVEHTAAKIVSCAEGRGLHCDGLDAVTGHY